MALQPKSFRFTDETVNKLKFIAEENMLKEVNTLQMLIEREFEKKLHDKLSSIVHGTSLNPVDDLANLIKAGFISKEYMLYSMTIPPVLRKKVLSVIEEDEK